MKTKHLKAIDEWRFKAKVMHEIANQMPKQVAEKMTPGSICPLFLPLLSIFCQL